MVDGEVVRLRSVSSLNRAGARLILLPGLSTAAQEYIRHEYMHKTNTTDGEIFKRVLDAENKSDETTATRWSAMLTARKRRNLRELKNVDGGGFLAAITPLLPFAAFESTFNLVLSTVCCQWGAAR